MLNAKDYKRFVVINKTGWSVDSGWCSSFTDVEAFYSFSATNKKEAINLLFDYVEHYLLKSWCYTSSKNYNIIDALWGIEVYNSDESYENGDSPIFAAELWESLVADQLK